MSKFEDGCHAGLSRKDFALHHIGKILKLHVHLVLIFVFCFGHYDIVVVMAVSLELHAGSLFAESVDRFSALQNEVDRLDLEEALEGRGEVRKQFSRSLRLEDLTDET